MRFTSPIDLIRVTGVRHVRGHVLWLQFSDGLQGEVDLADALPLGPVFEPLRDPMVFAQVQLDGGETIAWPNGADWAPEALHEQLRIVLGSPAQSYDDGSIEEQGQLVAMPELSRFFGIIIRMYFDDHAPPHFHAQYGELVASIEIDRDEVTTGRFPGRPLNLVIEWRRLHRDELLANWERLRRGEPVQSVAPLE